MQILPLNCNNYNYNYKNNTPAFKAYSTNGLNNDNNISYKTTSNFYRADLCWEKFVDFIINKYKNVDKVNIINHACSAGYEPYSLLMLLTNTLGEVNCKKFLPIIARDIDNNAIMYAQKGEFEATLGEYTMAQHYGGRFASKYYDENIFDNFCKVSRLENPTNWNPFEEYDPKNEYLISFNLKQKNYVDFKQSNIFNDKDLISKDNTILLFRNAWKYLGEDGIDRLSDFLANNMKKSSILVIGEFDIQNNIDKILIHKGFKDTLYYKFSEPLVFEAPE